jgi:hypothetical protein
MLAIMKQRSKDSSEQHQQLSQGTSQSALSLSPSLALSTARSTSRSSYPQSSARGAPRSLTEAADDVSLFSYDTNASAVTYKTKYEPQKSIHEEIAYVFQRPIRSAYSRGHEIPQPQSPHEMLSSSDFRHSPPHGHGHGRGQGHRSLSQLSSRPHTSGTKLPPCFSPIRPLERSRHLYSRATSPVMLRHGRHIPVDMISIKYKYPLNNISYERPSALASNIMNASLPSGAENILDDTRFQSIAPFTKRVSFGSPLCLTLH